MSNFKSNICIKLSIKYMRMHYTTRYGRGTTELLLDLVKPRGYRDSDHYYPDRYR